MIRYLSVCSGIEAAAHANRDDYDDIPVRHSDLLAKRGEFGGRTRDIGEPMQPDYDDMAEASIDAMREAGFVLVPREPTHEMNEAGADGANKPFYAHDARKCWQDMINAALQEEPK